MDLGSDAGAVARRLERRKDLRDLLAAQAVAVFLLFVLVTSISLAPGPVLFPGELPAEVAALVGAATLAALVGTRILADDRRDDAELARLGLGNWLPEGDRAEFEGDIAGLRAQIRRSVFTAAVWCWALAGCAALYGANSGGAEAETGTEALATVVAVADARVEVEYRVGGASRTAKLTPEPGDAYAVGQVVSVVYEPARPQDVRFAAERAEGVPVVAVLSLLVAVGYVVLRTTVVRALHCRRLDRAVRRTGWCRASVTVVPGSGARRRNMPDCEVRYRDGSVLTLNGTQKSRHTGVLAERPGRLAWIGGWGCDVVVLFPAGAAGERPYAIPAYAPGTRRS
ncbi:hypothetical protein MUY14_25010 [Amycolatopsis sp. FBCC-B4732]|uniref:hypothetical protein n=1 Tax=Amycolatopsis sp. FBCC-B4732 TaxID=3079339 RepID=UPI001FF0F255|nr:hypothetical protein [Amycolatopsis sp. FBCC-B4732]UOX85062.1 hypothetical protein MUY14_25010 [Amycolatopsis sp. FBCC-B4732]